MKELLFDGELKRDKRGNSVRRIQEWLSLRSIGLVVDGHFGAATGVCRAKTFRQGTRAEPGFVASRPTYDREPWVASSSPRATFSPQRTLPSTHG